MKYKVINTCFWNKKVWYEGEETESDVVPPKHFVPLKDWKEVEAPGHDPMAPKPMSYGQPVKAATGFAAKLDDSTQAMVQTMPKIKRSRKS